MNSRMGGNDFRMQKSSGVEQGRAGSSGQHYVTAVNQRTELIMICLYLGIRHEDPNAYVGCFS